MLALQDFDAERDELRLYPTEDFVEGVDDDDLLIRTLIRVKIPDSVMSLRVGTSTSSLDDSR